MDRSEALQGVAEEYEKLRADAVIKRDIRVREIYNKVPEIKEIDLKINEIGSNTLNEILKNPDKKGFLATKRKWYRGDIIIYNIVRLRWFVIINYLPFKTRKFEN